METECVSLSAKTLLDAKARRAGVFLTEVDLVERDQRVVVDIPPDARVAITPAGRKMLSLAGNKRWRWSQGGALLIVRLADMIIVPIRLRDRHAPSWGGHYTAPTGLASTYDEWVEPYRLIREGFEEVLIATADGIVVPLFEEARLNRIAWGAVASGVSLVRQEECLPALFTSGRFVNVPASIHHSPHEKDILVRLDGEECSHTRALAIFDDGTRGIDIMYPVILDMTAYRLDDISIFCGEDLNGKSLDSEMACLELDLALRMDKIVRAFKTGRPLAVTGDITKMTPVLREPLAML